MNPRLRWATTSLRVALAVGVRPGLWGTAVRTIGRLARPQWWRRAPFAPLPDPAYWHFRLVTAFGGEGNPRDLSSRDVVAYLQWCQRMDTMRG
jgi:hypothetical protein